jgi:hypothetical protein
MNPEIPRVCVLRDAEQARTRWAMPPPPSLGTTCSGPALGIGRTAVPRL